MSIDAKIKFVSLSFINTHEELKRQIINTTIWSYYAKNSELDLLGNLLESTQYGYTASASDTGSHKLLRITDILNGCVKWKQVPYCDCNKSKEYLLQAGDILVARTGGTTGKSFLVNDVPDNAVFASYLIRLRAKEKKFESVIYSMMNSYLFWSQITELKSGSAQPNVNAEKLKKILIPKIKAENLPEIIEVLNGNLSINQELQEKINEVQNKLNQLEEISSEFSHQYAIITKLRQTILQDAFQGKLVAQNSNDEPASGLLKKIKLEKGKLIAFGKLKKEKPLPPIKEDEIPFELPDGWAWCRLGEIINISSGDGLTSSQMNKNGSVPVFGGNGINGYHDKFNVDKETIVIGRVGYYCGSVHLTPKKAWVTDNAFIVKYSETNLYQDYLITLLNGLELGKSQYAGSQPVISGMRVYPKLVPLPPYDEQKRIAKRINEMYSNITKLEEEIQYIKRKAQDLMQAVLQEAFN